MRATTLWAVGALALTAASGGAQFVPGNQQASLFNARLFSNNPFAGGLNSYNYGYNSYFSFSAVNPTTGAPVFLAYDRSFNSNIPAGLGVGGVGYGGGTNGGYGNYANPYLMGQAGYAGQGLNPIAVEQARLARQGARAAPEPVAPRAAPRPARPAEAPPVPESADPAAIRSGAAINAMLPKINDRLDAGNRADSPLLPSELLRNLVYTPGPAADLLHLLRDGAPAAPAALAAPGLADVKADLTKLAEPLVKAVLAGKPTGTEPSKKLAAAVAAVRPRVDAQAVNATVAERAAAKRYLDGLAALAQVDSTPELRGVYSPAFASVGASAVDYARYARKHNLKLAPAAGGSVGAHEALYRALASTKATLDRAAR